MKFFAISALFFSVLCPLKAQERNVASKVPPPQPPFIKRVALPAAWTITFTRPAADELVDLSTIRKAFGENVMGGFKFLKIPDDFNKPIAKPMIRSLHVTRAAGFTKETASFSDNKKQITHIFGSARIIRHDAYDGLVRSRRGFDVVAYSPDFEVADFAGFGWLSLENYQGVQNVMGRECYLFSDKVESEDAKMLKATGMKPAAAEDSKFTARAFIDIKTRLPVMLQIGQETRVYAMVKPNPADLVVPQEVYGEIRAWKTQLTSATKAAPPP